MCRALKVMCLAQDPETLSLLKRSALSADWELTPGVTSPEEAFERIEAEKPHVLVVWGDGFEQPLAQALETRPSLRVIADRDLQGAAVVHSLDEVRGAILGRPRPGGPVR